MHYEIASTNWSALTRIVPLNVERYVADLCLLDPGVIVNSVTGAVTAGASSTVSDLGVTHDHKSLVWFIHAAAAEESFTLRLTVVTNDGQTLIFSVDYVVG